MSPFYLYKILSTFFGSYNIVVFLTIQYYLIP